MVGASGRKGLPTHFLTFRSPYSSIEYKYFHSCVIAETQTQTPKDKNQTETVTRKPIQFQSPIQLSFCVPSFVVVGNLPQEFEIWSIINIHFYLRNAATTWSFVTQFPAATWYSFCFSPDKVVGEPPVCLSVSPHDLFFFLGVCWSLCNRQTS